MAESPQIYLIYFNFLIAEDLSERRYPLQNWINKILELHIHVYKKKIKA